MRLGPQLVVFGALVGALTLSFSLYSLASALPYDSIAVASVDAQMEQNTQAISTIEATVSSSGCDVSMHYPEAVLHWCKLITEQALRHNLAPDLVAAVVLQESGGSPTAYSKSGAVGLMQVMPRDGLAAGFMCVNGPCFSDRPTISELEDPAFNIEYGTQLLSKLVQRNGSMRDGLKAYGPMDVGYYYADKVLGLYQRYGN
jgi:hypothetical protein